MPQLKDFSLPDIKGDTLNLADAQGDVVLLVNTASQCGLTPQYASLELLHRDYKDQGLRVIGFPANNFGGQEPGTEDEIKTFCETHFEVSFPLSSKISVKGSDRHPLYAWLAEATGEEPQWNFHKYLVGKDGKSVTSIAPTTTVDDAAFRSLLEAALHA